MLLRLISTCVFKRKEMRLIFNSLTEGNKLGCLKQSAKDVRRKFLGSHRQQIQKRPWLVNEASSSQTLMS